MIGGLAVSVVVTVFLVPAVYLMVHGKDTDKKNKNAGGTAGMTWRLALLLGVLALSIP